MPRQSPNSRKARRYEVGPSKYLFCSYNEPSVDERHWKWNVQRQWKALSVIEEAHSSFPSNQCVVHNIIPKSSGSSERYHRHFVSRIFLYSLISCSSSGSPAVSCNNLNITYPLIGSRFPSLLTSGVVRSIEIFQNILGLVESLSIMKRGWMAFAQGDCLIIIPFLAWRNCHPIQRKHPYRKIVMILPITIRSTSTMLSDS